MSGKTLRLEITSLEVLVYQSSESDDWVVKTMLRSPDVDSVSRELGDFSTTYKGGKPTDGDVIDTVMAALKHEIMEQLGLDPHHLGERVRERLEQFTIASVP